MSQLSFYHELFHPTNQATFSSTSEDVKVDHHAQEPGNRGHKIRKDEHGSSMKSLQN